jgi:hypothetical protein
MTGAKRKVTLPVIARSVSDEAIQFFGRLRLKPGLLRFARNDDGKLRSKAGLLRFARNDERLIIYGDN